MLWRLLAHHNHRALLQRYQQVSDLLRFTLLSVNLGLLNLSHHLGVVESRLSEEDLEASDNSWVAVRVLAFDYDSAMRSLIEGVVHRLLLVPHLLHLHLWVHIHLRLAHLVHVVPLVLLLILVIRLMVVRHLHLIVHALKLSRLIAVVHTMVLIIWSPILRVWRWKLFLFQFLLTMGKWALLVVRASTLEVEFTKFRFVVAARLRWNKWTAALIREVHKVWLHSVLLKTASSILTIEATSIASSHDNLVIRCASATVTSSLRYFILMLETVLVV